MDEERTGGLKRIDNGQWTIDNVKLADEELDEERTGGQKYIDNGQLETGERVNFKF